jgi:dihydrofolate synthase / folylpolyglutamate synthase
MTSTYREALDFIVATGSRGIKAGLERTEALLAALDHPERGQRGALVAGTNGKGSVCAMLEAACRAAGLRTVLLTKPHLTSYRERIALDGRPVSGEEFAMLVDEVRPAVAVVEPQTGAPTQFEILTALGILAARRHDADVVVCEVGLGGRLDSTNVLDLGVAVVTNVALDHREYLGDTIAEIATEKAGILKPGNAVATGATGEALTVVTSRAATVGASSLRSLEAGIHVDGSSRGMEGVTVNVAVGAMEVTANVPLRGAFQIANAGLAVATAAAMSECGIPLDIGAVQRGLETVEWPARLQWLPGEPGMLIDGAHNPAAMAAIVPAVRELVGERPLVALVGCMMDKDVAGILAELRPLEPIPVFTQAGTPRATPAMELARTWGPGARAITALPDALVAARLLAGRDGVVLVCGSLYLAGDVLRLVAHRTD